MKYVLSSDRHDALVKSRTLGARDLQPRKRRLGEPFRVGEKVKIWRGEHSGKVGEVVGTDGFDVKVKSGEEVVSVPNIQVVNTMDLKMVNEEKWGKDEGKKMNKSQEQVKPFTRTRKGKLERVKGFSRIRDIAKYPKATDEAAVHQFAKDYVVSKKKAKEYLEEQKQHLKWERTHSGKFGEPYKVKEDVSVPIAFPMSRRSTRYSEGIKAGRADKILGIRLNIAATSPDRDYAEGYRSGNINLAKEPIGQPISVREQKSVIRRVMSGELPRVDEDRLEEEIEETYEKIQYRSKGSGPDVEGWVVEGSVKGKWYPIEEFGPDEEHKAELKVEELQNQELGEPISTYGMASLEEEDGDETEAVSPEGGTSETKRLSGNEIMDVMEAKETINKLVDMSNTIIDDNAVSRMKDELNKLEISNDWELQDYKELVEFSEGELRDAKEKGYRSANEHWQAEMSGTVTAISSRKIRKGMKLMTIDEVLNLKKSKSQYDFGKEVPIGVMEKAIQVKPFTRTRKGKLERVKGFSREAPTYSQYESAVNYAKNIKFMPTEKAIKWAKMAIEFEQAIQAEKEISNFLIAHKAYGKKDAKMMREMHLGDAKDLQAVYSMWKREDYDGAYNRAWDMDTAARDNIPLSVWNDISKYAKENLGEPYKTTKARPPTRIKLDADLHRRGLVRGDWDVITQKQNEDGSLTLGIKAIQKYKTPSHIEADIFSEEVSKPVGDMIRVRINSSGDILEVLGPVGEPFVAEHKKISDKWETDLADKLGAVKDKMQNKQPVSKKELDDLIQETDNWRQFKVGEPISTEDNVASRMRKRQIANTILTQMGGAGKLKLMTGAKNFIALDSGVSFEFPTVHRRNYIKVTLEPDDTYTVEFGRKKRITPGLMGAMDPEKPISMEDFYTKISEHTDIYFDQLKELFEKETGLYLSFGKSVTSGEKYVVSLEKSRTPGAKDKQPRKRKGTGEINRENLVGRISEEHGIHPDDMKTIWKKLQQGKDISEEYGIHPDELPAIKAKLNRMYKSKGGFRMARGGAMGEEEKASDKKQQDVTGEKTQAQERLSGYAKRRREEQAPAKNADTDEGGDSEEMSI